MFVQKGEAELASASGPSDGPRRIVEVHDNGGAHVQVHVNGNVARPVFAPIACDIRALAG